MSVAILSCNDLLHSIFSSQFMHSSFSIFPFTLCAPLYKEVALKFKEMNLCICAYLALK